MCFVTELCSGGDLYSFIKKRRRLIESHAKYFFVQILKGLAALHKVGILHRDIKLENVMLTVTGELKIGDFGVSRKMRPTEVCKEQCGTPAYIAPELIERNGYTGFKADMWSAGVSLYAMVVGTVPFKAAQITKLNELIKSAKYNYSYQSGSMPRTTANAASQYSPELRDLIGKLLTVDPSKRLSAEQALQHPWLRDAPTHLDDLFTEKERSIFAEDYKRLNQELDAENNLVEISAMLTEHPLDTIN